MKDRFTSEVLILNDKNEILLQKKTYDYPPCPGGFWCPFGGVIEENESAEETIKREIVEELGLKNIEIKFYKDIISYLKEFKVHRSIFVGRFHGNLEDIRITEGAGFGFFDIREIDSLKLLLEDIELYKGLINSEVF
jgi:8-oxo-dGTP pyrophosphatase MutT (NUDIX family)